MKYSELREKHQKEVDAFPFGFAFNDEQFKEMMKGWGLKPSDTDKIYNIGAGGYVRKSDSAAMYDMISRHNKEMDEAKKDTKFLYGMFMYELANHEWQFLMDDEDVLAACGYDDEEEMTYKEKAVFKKAKIDYLDYCKKNDIF